MATVPNPVSIRHESDPELVAEIDESTLDHWRTLGWSPVDESATASAKARRAAEKSAAENQTDPTVPALAADEPAPIDSESEGE